MLATAFHSEEMPSRLELPPRGPHAAEAYFVRNIFKYQESIRPGLSQRRFALEDLEVSMAAWNNWIDGKSRIRSDSRRKLEKYAPPNLRRPLGLVDDGESLATVPQTPYDSSSPKLARGYMVTTNEGAIIAKMLDRIADDYERTMALSACIAELRKNPRGVVTERSPDRPTASKNPPAK